MREGDNVPSSSDEIRNVRSYNVPTPYIFMEGCLRPGTNLAMELHELEMNIKLLFYLTEVLLMKLYSSHSL
jgi:hypothetical protein